MAVKWFATCDIGKFQHLRWKHSSSRGIGVYDNPVNSFGRPWPGFPAAALPGHPACSDPIKCTRPEPRRKWFEHAAEWLSLPQQQYIMQTQTFTSQPIDNEKLFIKMVLDAWQTYNDRFDKLVAAIPADQLLQEVAPGRNRGIYLLGHLVTVSDGMLPLLGLGEKLYPQLAGPFLANADDPACEIPSVAELTHYGTKVNAQLAAGIDQMQPADWFTRHQAVSEEDFAREPHRNKLNIIINRTNHLSYHLGQLAFLAKRSQ